MNGYSWEDDASQEGLLTRRSAQTCLSDKEIGDFLFNRLSGVTREVIEEHLLVCHACLDRVESEEAFIPPFREAAKQLEQEDLERAFHGKQESARPEGESWWKRLRDWFANRSNGGLQLLVAGMAVVAVVTIFVPSHHGVGPAAQVLLQAERGGTEQAAVPARQALLLSSDVRDLESLPVYQTEIVDSAGRLIHGVNAARVSGKISWRLDGGLPAGRYWVRLRNPQRPESLLREYSLTVK